MKRLCILELMLFLAILVGSAQNISVKSFQLLETDLTANLEGTMEIDQNGEVAALIKVITTETGFMFDVGMLGIVRQVQNPGEIWLYVPHGVQRISINHQRLGRLEEPYYFPIPVQQARTYELVLTASRVKTIVEEDAGGGYLALKVTPPSAMVFVDDKPQALNADGSISMFLLYGEHTYRVEAPGCKPESGTVNIKSEETQTIIVNLSSQMAHVVLSVPMSDAEIWVNNVRKGVGQWTGSLAPGAYVIETRKEGCRPQRTTVTLAEEEERTLALQAPEPIFGRLRADSNPLEAEVWLGDKKLGSTPGVFSNVPVGSHSFLFIKDGYQSKTVDVTIEEGKIATASAKLEKDGSPTFEATPKTSSKGKEKSPRHQEGKKEARPSLLKKTGFYVGAHFQVCVPFATGFSLGGYLSGFHAEGYVAFANGLLGSGYGGSDEVTWYYLDDDRNITAAFNQTYRSKMFYSGSIGYCIPLGLRVRLTPRVGVDLLTIGAEVSDALSLEQSTYILSATASLRAEFAVSRRIALTITPVYRLPVQRGATADILYRSRMINGYWNNSFAPLIGFCFNF
jgi:PEGA domain.